MVMQVKLVVVVGLLESARPKALDSLKRLLYGLRKKPSMGAPESSDSAKVAPKAGYFFPSLS